MVSSSIYVFLTSNLHNILSKHWLLFTTTIVATKDSGERGMNPVAMTIINPWKEIGQAGDRTSDQVRYDKDLPMGLGENEHECGSNDEIKSLIG